MKQILLMLSLTLLTLSYIIEYVFNIPPCPLCLMQRYSLMFMSVSALMINYQYVLSRLKHLSFGIFNTLGIYFAMRQLYLQMFPDKHLACAPSVEILFQYFPYKDILYTLFLGSGDCSEVGIKFLGLSIALWSLLGFMITFSLWILILKKYPGVKNKSHNKY